MGETFSAIFFGGGGAFEALPFHTPLSHHISQSAEKNLPTLTHFDLPQKRIFEIYFESLSILRPMLPTLGGLSFHFSFEVLTEGRSKIEFST